MKTVIAEIAKRLAAMNNCEALGNVEWFGKHRAALEDLTRKYLPSGSGLDRGVTVLLPISNTKAVHIEAPYHCMNEHGYYMGWIDYTVVARADLCLGIEVDVIFDEGLYTDLVEGGIDLEGTADYLAEIFDHHLTKEIF